MPSTSRVSTDVEARYKRNEFRAVFGVRLDHDAVHELSVEAMIKRPETRMASVFLVKTCF